MKKSELKTGMIVKLRNGDYYVVMLNTGFTFSSASKNVLVGLTKSYSWLTLNDYDDYLRMREEEFKCFDIMEVYQPNYCTMAVANKEFNCNKFICECDDYFTLYSRNDKMYDFLKNKELMEDFVAMDRGEFLSIHDEIDEETYDTTKRRLMEKLGF